MKMWPLFIVPIAVVFLIGGTLYEQYFYGPDSADNIGDIVVLHRPVEATHAPKYADALHREAAWVDETELPSASKSFRVARLYAESAQEYNSDANVGIAEIERELKEFGK